MTPIDITTAKGRAALPPRRDPYFRREGEAHIGFRCTGQQGEGIWIGRMRQQDKYTFQTLGRHPDYRSAVEALKEWVGDINAGRIIAKRKGPTVADAVRSYLENIKRTKGDGRTEYQHPLNAMERTVLGREASKRRPAVDANRLAEIPLDALTKQDLRDWKASLLGGVAEADAPRPQKATASRRLKILKAALNFAFADGMTQSNSAWAGIDNFRDTRARAHESYRYLTPAERQSLITAAPPEIQTFIRALATSGCRPIELQRLRNSDIDRYGRVTLWSRKGKTSERHERIIPMKSLPGFQDAIEQAAKGKIGKAFLFPQETEFWLRPFKQAVIDAMLPDDVTAYCLRHSFITDAINEGVPIHTVATVCGTSVEQIEQTYGKLLESHATAAFAKLHAFRQGT